MAGDIQGTTVLTGLSITSTPGSGQTSPNPAAAPALSMFGTSSLTLGSGVSMFVNSGATMTFLTGSSLSAAAGTVQIGGLATHVMSSTSSLVAPFVVAGSASSFTIIIWAAANPGDQILVAPLIGATVSSISSGLVAHSHCTLAGQIEFRLSNVSTLVQNQSTRSWVFTRIVPSF